MPSFPSAGFPAHPHRFCRQEARGARHLRRPDALAALLLASVPGCAAQRPSGGGPNSSDDAPPPAAAAVVHADANVGDSGRAASPPSAVRASAKVRAAPVEAMPRGFPDRWAMRDLVASEVAAMREAEWYRRDSGRGDDHKGVTRTGERPGRYQVTRVSGDQAGWIIRDMESGVFEHWVAVPKTSKYHVFRRRYGGDCPWIDKRSVDRGSDPRRVACGKRRLAIGETPSATRCRG